MELREQDLYCPICGRIIEPSNEQEVMKGEHDGYLYVHDKIEHTTFDMKALESGLH